MRTKFERDGIRLAECDMFLVSFGPEHYYLRVDDHFETVHLRARFRHLRPFYALVMMLRLPALLRARGYVPDAVVTYDMSLVPAAARVRKETGARVVLFVANLPATLLKTRPLARLKLFVEAQIERIAVPRVDVCFVNSRAAALYAQHVGIPASRTHRFFPDTLSRDSADLTTAREHKGSVRAALAVPDGHLMLLSVGRLEPEKGFDRLLTAFAALALKEATLVIAGDGILRDRLEVLAVTLGVADHVRFAGTVPHHELWRYYVDADVFLLFSRSESLGMVPLEAMYVGTPCIVSRAEGLLESAGEKGERAFVWGEENGIEALDRELDRIRTAHPTIAERVARARMYVAGRLSEYNGVMEMLSGQNEAYNKN